MTIPPRTDNRDTARMRRESKRIGSPPHRPRDTMNTNETTTETERQKECREYWETVQRIAKEAKEAEKRGEDPSDFIHESVDGAHHVIYTYANAIVLREGRHEDAAFDAMGDDALAGVKSYGELMARLAYFAMRADVQDEFDELPDDPDAE